VKTTPNPSATKKSNGELWLPPCCEPELLLPFPLVLVGLAFRSVVVEAAVGSDEVSDGGIDVGPVVALVSTDESVEDAACLNCISSPLKAIFEPSMTASLMVGMMLIGTGELPDGLRRSELEVPCWSCRHHRKERSATGAKKLR
jgi:hypothetical protein